MSIIRVTPINFVGTYDVRQSMIDTLVLPQQNLLLLQAETIAKQIEAVAALAAKASEIGC